jgi:HK97 family phage portal protein
MGLFMRNKHVETRDTLERPGTTLKEYFEYLDGLGDNSAGVKVNPTSAIKISAVYACINGISQTLGEIPIEVYEETDDGKRVAKDHYLRKLLKFTPNKIMTSSVFRETGQSNILAFGNFYARIIKNKREEPEELIILDPKNVEVLVSKNKRTVVYDFTDPDTGKTRRFTSDEIFHIPAFSYNGIVGFSPIRQAAETMGWGGALQKFGNRFFGNGATLLGVITAPGKLKQGVIDVLRKMWVKTYGGTDRSHQTAVLDAGMTYNKIGIPPEEAQFIQSRKFSVEEIARIYRMPPHLIQHLEKSSFNNIEQQSLEFVKYTMLPWIKKWEQEINRKLLLEKDKGKIFSHFVVDGLLRGDAKARGEFYQTMKLNKILTSNEIRRIEGFNDFDQESARVLEGTNNIPDKEEPSNE